MSDHQYYANRMRELTTKFGLDSLVLEDAPRHTIIQTNAQQFIDQEETRRAVEEQSYLKTRTVAYGSAKPIRLWISVTPNR